MASVRFSERALADLERLFDFLAASDPPLARVAVERIAEATRILAQHPLIGRPVRGTVRELVISSGKTGYVALYRLQRGLDEVQILAVRHQREAGFGE
ncbi:MAG: type II toxin-antitoxin system RelE/ParE family toxin [Burkholderiales bacterium]|jgi:plasmid stabilization system protein ParE